MITKLIEIAANEPSRKQAKFFLFAIRTVPASTSICPTMPNIDDNYRSIWRIEAGPWRSSS
ncbi:MAG: hypothetical protein A3D96_00035 [Chlamydiae bacterium RIFCSPHIGHO2_12_FULL_44_59]|nr:MAG: hypothetical protein A2796_04040 [Chlamydiae bacterium RIFCSPHIGHO2_01_FULL_44_39]OGN58373.1 MAG: hypothetical protein A3C42_01530 [Chlamydiae bacterium RIFCSPHIGHO2_02_FULL_45_9]OGN60913.1 MAG: hypothetical protein A3D96_00035 [Chlamydiae bacterium RIFCSPHIGHO2_12_FULL_44_59]OGN66513.1 MAG: hypothetical protein A2978_05510 [Chlamydiae bacterium RIFCSPLOWO2_01_FULL_44_52]OGN69556.1 MAG: hypothetical protein A3I67_00930 [Chlamydiae bacterium RIFCSPLOWO2_02_FULL_45_22]OGN70832.1 MAG: hyp